MLRKLTLVVAFFLNSIAQLFTDAIAENFCEHFVLQCVQVKFAVLNLKK